MPGDRRRLGAVDAQVRLVRRFDGFAETPGGLTCEVQSAPPPDGCAPRSLRRVPLASVSSVARSRVRSA